MTKISIARRRLECTESNSYTMAEWNARARQVAEPPRIERLIEPPSVPPKEAPSPTRDGISLSLRQGSFLDSILNKPEIRADRMGASLKKKATTYTLKLKLSNPMGKKFLTPADVSEMLSISRGTIYKYAKTGKLKGYHFGRSLRFDFEDVLEFLSGSLTPKPERKLEE